MSEENTHNECKFLGHERPLGLEWPKNLHEWWVFPTNFQKSQSREWYLFRNDVFPNSCEENKWGKQSLEWGKYCQNDTKNCFHTLENDMGGLVVKVYQVHHIQDVCIRGWRDSQSRPFLGPRRDETLVSVSSQAFTESQSRSRVSKLLFTWSQSQSRGRD